MNLLNYEFFIELGMKRDKGVGYNVWVCGAARVAFVRATLL